MNILFENKNIKVFMNSSDEVFVQVGKTKTTLRIRAEGNNIFCTAAGHDICPTSINGLPAFSVKSRRCKCGKTCNAVAGICDSCLADMAAETRMLEQGY